MDQEGRVLLMHRNTPKRIQWELPGGKIEEGEEPEGTARREIKEELGINVEIVKKIGEASFQEDGFMMDYLWFLARIESGDLELREDKFDDLRYFALEDMREMQAELSANTKNLVKLESIV